MRRAGTNMSSDVEAQLNTAQHQIRKLSWYGENWTLHPTRPDDGGTAWSGLQLSKKDWFNDDGMGIHIETWIGDKELTKSKLPFVLHILHQPAFPSSHKKGSDFTKIWHTLSEPAELITSWPGYKAGRAKPLKGAIKFRPEDMATTIVAEFSRLHVLGPYIDGVLKELLATE